MVVQNDKTPRRALMSGSGKGPHGWRPLLSSYLTPAHQWKEKRED